MWDYFIASIFTASCLWPLASFSSGRCASHCGSKSGQQQIPSTSSQHCFRAKDRASYLTSQCVKVDLYFHSRHKAQSSSHSLMCFFNQKEGFYVWPLSRSYDWNEGCLCQRRGIRGIPDSKTEQKSPETFQPPCYSNCHK